MQNNSDYCSIISIINNRDIIVLIWFCFWWKDVTRFTYRIQYVKITKRFVSLLFCIAPWVCLTKTDKDGYVDKTNLNITEQNEVEF